jgi:ribosomal protein S18 acetylase RimI-like enzyme
MLRGERPIQVCALITKIMIRYADSIESVTVAHVRGFFVGWQNPPSPETLLKLLKNSSEIVLAIDSNTGNVVGFITAISDRVLSAYIPLLEVLPENRKQGIGLELTRKMLVKLKDLYMVDLLCDEELQSFYAKLGMKRAQGMFLRNYDRQAGTK